MLKHQSLYKSLLGEKYNCLPHALQSVHNLSQQETKSYQGFYTAIVGNNVIARCIARLMSLPQSGESLPLRVEFQQKGHSEHWHRYFNHQLFSSIQYQKGNLLYEKVSLMTLAFQIESTSKGLSLQLQQLYLLKLPILQLCQLNVTGEEWEDNGYFHFNVKVKAPMIGLIIQYHGFLMD